MSIDIPKPFRKLNVEFPINVDFLPPLSFQAELDPKQELYHIDAHVSSILSKTMNRQTVGDLKIEIIRSTTVPEAWDIKWGSEKNPSDEVTLSQREIWNEIVNLGIPDAVIKKRGVIHTIPKVVEDLPCLDGANYIFAHHESYGNRARAIRRRLNIGVTNPYYLIRGELIRHNIIDTTADPRLKRIRSVLGTSYLIPDNDVGYIVLLEHAEELQNGLRSGKFWKDTAVPKRFIMSVDGLDARAILYKLQKNKKIIAL